MTSQEALLQPIPDNAGGRLHVAIIAADYLMHGGLLMRDALENDALAMARFASAVLVGIAWVKYNPEGAIHVLDAVERDFMEAVGIDIGSADGAPHNVAALVDSAYFGMEEVALERIELDQ